MGRVIASRFRCGDQALDGGDSGVFAVLDTMVSLTHVPEGSRRWHSAPSRQTVVGQQVAMATMSGGDTGRDASDALSMAAPRGSDRGGGERRLG